MDVLDRRGTGPEWSGGTKSAYLDWVTGSVQSLSLSTQRSILGLKRCARPAPRRTTGSTRTSGSAPARAPKDGSSALSGSGKTISYRCRTDVSRVIEDIQSQLWVNPGNSLLLRN